MPDGGRAGCRMREGEGDRTAPRRRRRPTPHGVRACRSACGRAPLRCTLRFAPRHPGGPRPLPRRLAPGTGTHPVTSASPPPVGLRSCRRLPTGLLRSATQPVGKRRTALTLASWYRRGLRSRYPRRPTARTTPKKHKRACQHYVLACPTQYSTCAACLLRGTLRRQHRQHHLLTSSVLETDCPNQQARRRVHQ